MFFSGGEFGFSCVDDHELQGPPVGVMADKHEVHFLWWRLRSAPAKTTNRNPCLVDHAACQALMGLETTSSPD